MPCVKTCIRRIPRSVYASQGGRPSVAPLRRKRRLIPYRQTNCTLLGKERFTGCPVGAPHWGARLVGVRSTRHIQFKPACLFLRRMTGHAMCTYVRKKPGVVPRRFWRSAIRQNNHVPVYPITCWTLLRYFAGIGFSSCHTMFIGRLPWWLM